MLTRRNLIKLALFTSSIPMMNLLSGCKSEYAPYLEYDLSYDTLKKI